MMLRELLAYALATGLGALILHLAFARARVTKSMQELLLNLADRMFADAIEANQHNEETLIKLYNQIIDVAAMLPLVASGAVFPQPDITMSESEAKEIQDFVNRNGWVVPYIFTTFMALKRMEFHGRPLNYHHWFPACLAWFLMRFKSRSDGAVKFVETGESARQIQEMVSIDSDKYLDGKRLA